jgi:hypothetical protein
VATVEETSALVIGSAVTCEDGTRGELGSLVVDATSLRLTAVVVGGAVEPARVVPIGLVSRLRDNGLEISCTSVSIEGLETAEPAKVVDVADETAGGSPVSLAYESDTSPDTFLRPRERVLASDGAVGRVHGCEIDVQRYPGQMAALLVDVGTAGETHLVAVPTRAITSMKGIVVLDMTKQTARELPSVEL